MGAMSKRVELPLKALEVKARAGQEGIHYSASLGVGFKGGYKY